MAAYGLECRWWLKAAASGSSCCCWWWWRVCDAGVKMLTSSDAKFRCMWYMVVWSILLMFMSQFFSVTNVIAFYIFASATMLLLPLVTSIYSTTSGNHGASLLRYWAVCLFTHSQPFHCQVTTLGNLLRHLGQLAGVVVRASDLWSRDHEFDSQLVHCRVA